jgi:hypothetical protein
LVLHLDKKAGSKLAVFNALPEEKMKEMSMQIGHSLRSGSETKRKMRFESTSKQYRSQKQLILKPGGS